MSYPKIFAHSFYVNNLPSTVQNLDADGEFAGAQFRNPRAGTIKTVHVFFRDANQWPANGIRVHLTPVDLATNGSPPVIGSDYAFFDYLDVPPGIGPNIGSQYVSLPYITSDGTATGAMKTLAIGEYFGITCSFLNFQAGDSFTLGGWSGINGWNLAKMRNISYYFNGSNWALGPSGNQWPVVLEYTDGVSIPVGTMTAQRGNNVQFPWPRERGLKLTPNIPIRSIGIFVSLSNTPNAGNELRVYSADGGPPLKKCTWSIANRHAHANLGTFFPYDGGGTLALQAGKSYRFVAAPQSGLSNHSVNRFSYQSQYFRDIDLQADGGFEMVSTERLDASDDDGWVEEPLELDVVFPVIDAIDPVKGEARVPLFGSRFVRWLLEGVR